MGKNVKMSPILKALFIFVLLIFAGCKNDKTEPEYAYLIGSKLIANVTVNQVLFMAGYVEGASDMLSSKELSNVSVFKLTYRTFNADSTEIIASGAILVPVTEQPLPILSYQHGTLFDKNDAPSLFSSGQEVKVLAPILASAGYVVCLPDYIGYGESSEYQHPYEHSKSLATASFDMLMASKEFLEETGIELSDKLFLTGYSEGGNATMALHRHIEEHSDMVVTMSAPASGAYNKTAFAKEIVQRNEDLDFLPNFMWVIHSYNSLYEMNRLWSSFINEPYASTLEAIDDPMELADANISHNPQVLFTTATINGIVNGTDTELMNALADNDNFNWTPRYPITLYYGTADDYVFPLNSATAFEALTNNGATVNQLVYEGLNHETALIPYVLDMFELFESLK